MRVIKFRVWNEHDHKMYEPWILDEELQEEDGVYGSDNTYLQYVGLKDKNGVEIYEGDVVVKTDRWHDGVAPFTGEVVYDDYCAAFGIRDGTVDHNTTSSIDETRDKYEVIGNIYENP